MLKIFDNIRLIKENKELKTSLRFLNKELEKLRGINGQLEQDIANLRADFMRIMKDDSIIQVSIDDKGKVTEYTRYTPNYYLIDKRGNINEHI